MCICIWTRPGYVVCGRLTMAKGVTRVSFESPRWGESNDGLLALSSCLQTEMSATSAMHMYPAQILQRHQLERNDELLQLTMTQSVPRINNSAQCAHCRVHDGGVCGTSYGVLVSTEGAQAHPERRTLTRARSLLPHVSAQSSLKRPLSSVIFIIANREIIHPVYFLASKLCSRFTLPEP